LIILVTHVVVDGLQDHFNPGRLSIETFSSQSKVRKPALIEVIT